MWDVRSEGVKHRKYHYLSACKAFNVWYTDIENCFQVGIVRNGYTNTVKASQLVSVLQRQAADVFQGISVANRVDRNRENIVKFI